MTREITINNKATVKANGELNSNNCKRVVRLYPFTVYTSVTDAAASICTTPQNMSRYLHDEKTKCIKGVQFCFLSELERHLDVLAVNSQSAANENDANKEDARKWREYQAEQEAKAKAEQERIAAIEKAKADREERKAKLEVKVDRRRRIIERLESELQKAKERLNDTLVELDILCAEEENESEVSVA